MLRHDSDTASPVDKIMKKPDKLHDLDLDAFAIELQRRVIIIHVHVHVQEIVLLQ